MLEQLRLLERENAGGMSRSDTEDPLKYLDDVLRYAFARLGSREEAEDVAMEVFQAAFRFQSQLPKRKDPRLYLIGITRRKITDHLRRQVREVLAHAGINSGALERTKVRVPFPFRRLEQTSVLG